ncbi:MAG TPA: hypothetical protein VGB53_10330 [Rubricoccaceae bacterium]|jgi:type I restriction enzyme R subunit
MHPEAKARVEINALLAAAGWAVQDHKRMNLSNGPGVVVLEFPFQTGAADYLLFVDRKAIGVIEAEPGG